MAAFDPTRCGTDSVAPIGAIDLVPSCTVPSGPDRLHDCQLPTLQTPAPKVKGPPGHKGHGGGERGDKGPTGGPGRDGRNGCTPIFLPPIVTYHLIGSDKAATADVTLTQADCQFQFSVDLGFPAGTEVFDVCNLWLWCAGGWVPYVLNDPDHIEPPPVDGEYDGQSKWVCDCSLSSLSGG